MLERAERTLKIACLALAALLLFQLARLGARKDPLANLSIPALPSLSRTTNAPATSSQTVAPARSSPGQSPTNAVAPPGAGQPGPTALAPEEAIKSGAASVARPGSSNRVMGAAPPAAVPRMGVNPMGPGGPGLRGPPLPPALQARVDRIIDSELLAPIIRPLPMALLGIAGKDVFLRAPNGQTGLVKEGGEVGGVKLLRIGINRVLVEAEGQQKELTIFSGLGGESLLPKEKETPQ